MAEKNIFLLRSISADKKKKIFIRAGSLQDVVSEFQKKMELPADKQYTVYQDGTEIVEDEIFTALCEDAKERGVYLEVTALPEGTPWLDPSQVVQSTFDSESVGTSTSTDDDSSLISSRLSTVTNVSDNTTASSPVHNSPRPVPLCNNYQSLSGGSTSNKKCFQISLVSEFLDPVLEKFSRPVKPKNIQDLKKAAIKQSFNAIGHFMIHTLKNFEKPTALRLAKLVLNHENGKYKCLFEVIFDGVVVDTGLDRFTQQIYAHVSAKKGPENIKQRGQKRVRGESDSMCADEDGLLPPALRKQDKYGCVAWDVAIPDGETEDTLETMREKLVSMVGEDSSQEVMRLMEVTYAAQRIAINAGKPMIKYLPSIIEKWPLLILKNHFFNHAKILLGKDVVRVWNKCLGEKASKIMDFMDKYWNEDASKKKSKPMTTKMLKVLEETKEYRDASRSVAPNAVAVFELLVGFMGEKVSLLYQLLSAAASEEEVLNAAKKAKNYPVLVVRGGSLFDEHSKFDVVLVQKVIRASSATEGFLVLLLSFFVFNCDYPTDLHSTMEFCQRLFLQINPPPEDGNKREVQKRTVSHIDAKVKQLSDLLIAFTSEWNLAQEI